MYNPPQQERYNHSHPPAAAPPTPRSHSHTIPPTANPTQHPNWTSGRSTASRVFQSLYPPHLSVQIPPASASAPDLIASSRSPTSASSASQYASYPSDPASFQSRGLPRSPSSQSGRIAPAPKKLTKKHDSTTGMSSTSAATSDGGHERRRVASFGRPVAAGPALRQGERRPSQGAEAHSPGTSSRDSVSEGGVNYSEGSRGNATSTGEDPTERDFEEALRASREQEEMMRVQLESKRVEEERVIAAALAASSYSAEQDALRLRRIMEEAEEEENRILQQTLEQSRRDKGKGKAKEEDLEMEDLDLALAISLSEAEGKRREGGAETNAEAWERLVRIAKAEALHVPKENLDHRSRPPMLHLHSDTDITSHPHHSDTPSLPRRRTSSYYISNPDPDPDSPPIVQTNTIREEEPSPPAYDLQTRPPNPNDDDASIPTPTRPRRGPLPPIPTQKSPRPPSPSPQIQTHHHSHSATFYAPQIAALIASPVPIPSEEEEDPFDEKVAAVAIVHRDWDDLERSESEHEEEDDEHEHEDENQDQIEEVYTVRERRFDSITTTSTTSLAIESTSSSVEVTSVGMSTLRAGPMWGGFVATSGNNAVAEEQTVAGVQFGFVPVGRRNQHPPLENDGTLPFPDEVQLSRMGRPEGGSLAFSSFAVEGKTWMNLLVYLGWHGNSQIIAASGDLQQEKSEKVMSVAATLEFYRSFADNSTRVRIRLDLLPPLFKYNPLSDNTGTNSSSPPSSLTSFDPSDPSITVRLARPLPLPLPLTVLANQLSDAHTLSRQYASKSRSAWAFSGPAPLEVKAVKQLVQAIDLFKTLNGETLQEDARQVEEEEVSTLKKVKAMMRVRRKKGPGLVKGGADGTGPGRPLNGSGALPEAWDKLLGELPPTSTSSSTKSPASALLATPAVDTTSCDMYRINSVRSALGPFRQAQRLSTRQRFTSSGSSGPPSSGKLIGYGVASLVGVSGVVALLGLSSGTSAKLSLDAPVPLPSSSLPASPELRNLTPSAPFPDIDLLSVTVQELNVFLAEGKVTSVQLVSAFLERIDANNTKGLNLRAVIELAPLQNVLNLAATLDAERADGRVRGPLHGIPILVKDNIATEVSQGMETTAGSFALLGSKVPRDAHIVTLLRDAGAIIIGKTNLSEFANFKGRHSNGWSARGGQTQSAYVVGGFAAGGDPSGSSSGSAVGVSADFAPISVGTETDGSIISPANRAALFGIKPTVGLASRSGIIPISHAQDSPGPMARSAWDAAAMLTIMVGHDPTDSASEAAIGKGSDYTTALIPDGFRGLRIGVPRSHFYDPLKTEIEPEVYAETELALKKMQALGVVLIDSADLPSVAELWESKAEVTGMNYDFKEDLGTYLRGLTETQVLTLSDVIKFNDSNSDREMPKGQCCQEQFIDAVQTLGTLNKVYLDAQAENKDLADTRGLSAVFDKYQLDALVIPAEANATTPAAIAGWPICTVPLGYYKEATTPGKAQQPYGLSFTARPFEERKLVQIMGAFEENFEKRRVPEQLRGSRK